MVKHITQTFITRVITAFLMLVLVLLCTNTLPPGEYGTIGLIVLDISLIMLLNDLIGGSAMVYYTSRLNTFWLAGIGYLWAFMTLFIAAGTGLILSLFPVLFSIIIPGGFGIHILVLALINSFSTIHINILIGKEKISKYNVAFLVQIGSLIILVAILLFLFRIRTASMYIDALYGSYLLTWITGIVFTRKYFRPGSFSEIRSVISTIAKYGTFTQLANLIQLGNKRFNFYVIKALHGVAPLGIYNAAIQVTEGLRIIGQSVSLIQFSRISRQQDQTYSRDLTIRLLKMTILCTLILLIAMMAIPESIYAWIFGEQYRMIHTLVYCLAPGILSLNASMLMSSFFSGTGRPRYNMIASGIGFLFTLITIFPAVYFWNYLGAGLTTSIAYILSTIYQLTKFVKITGARRRDFIIRISDFTLFLQFIRMEFPGRSEK